MTGNGLYIPPIYKNADDWGMVNMTLFYPHYDCCSALANMSLVSVVSRRIRDLWKGSITGWFLMWSISISNDHSSFFDVLTHGLTVWHMAICVMDCNPGSTEKPRFINRGGSHFTSTLFKGCRPCRRPRKRETGNGVSWLRSSVLWIVSLDALYIHYIYIYASNSIYLYVEVKFC